MTDEKKSRKRKGLRRDNRIQVTYTDGYRADGKPNRISFYGKTRAEAVRKRDEYKKNGGRREDFSDITVAVWVEHYREMYRSRVNPLYQKIDSVPYKRLINDLGSMRLCNVKEAHLQQSLNALDGMSQSSIDKYHHVLVNVFDKAKRNKLIVDNPAEALTPPNGTKNSHRALGRWESAVIMQNWQSHPCGLWAMIMLLTGLRRSELIGLRWENVDLLNRTLTVCEVGISTSTTIVMQHRTKSIAGQRVIPVCNPLLDAFLTVPPEKRQGYVCTKGNGQPLEKRVDFTHQWKKYCKAMTAVVSAQDKNVEFSVRPHDLRHTFATALYDADVPAKAAQYYLGHSDVHITLELYTHLSKEKEKDSRIQLVGFLDNWLESTENQVRSLSL